jgi:dTDP-4-dehydrorhamnose reductase
MKRLLIPGVSGLFGLNLAMMKHGSMEVIGIVNQQPLPQAPFNVRQSDLTQAGAVSRLIEDTKPDLIINCAAVASLDACEQNRGLADQLNTHLPAEIAQKAASLSIPFIHLSTDAVFDGQKGRYTETDPPNPINQYARTKLRAEQLVAEANADAIIARINFYGWSLSGRRSLSEFFFNHLQAGKRLNGFVDLYYSPMLVCDLIDMLFQILEKNLHGLYHVSVDEALSKYDFGCRLARTFGFDEGLIEPISWKEAALGAVRSPDLTLDVSKLKAALGVPLPTVADGLERLKQQLQDGYRQRLMAVGG